LELIHGSLRCENKNQFIDLISILQSILPFQAVGLVLQSGQAAFDQESFTAFNVSYPAGFVDEYSARGYALVDPVVKECLGIPRLSYWEDCLRKHGAPEEMHDLIEEFGFRNARKGHGYSHGLTNLSAREKGLISFTGLPRAERTETVLSLAVPFLQEAVKRVRKPASRVSCLTDREREVLRWIAAGKSSWDVSVILKISERTVKFHTENIMTKLDAANRTHAVAIAMRARIITVD
jgi:DNA-binding CsgD family transcriptional regulator